MTLPSSGPIDINQIFLEYYKIPFGSDFEKRNLYDLSQDYLIPDLPYSMDKFYSKFVLAPQFNFYGGDTGHLVSSRDASKGMNIIGLESPVTVDAKIDWNVTITAHPNIAVSLTLEWSRNMGISWDELFSDTAIGTVPGGNTITGNGSEDITYLTESEVVLPSYLIFRVSVDYADGDPSVYYSNCYINSLSNAGANAVYKYPSAFIRNWTINYNH